MHPLRQILRILEGRAPIPAGLASAMQADPSGLGFFMQAAIEEGSSSAPNWAAIFALLAQYLPVILAALGL